MTDTTDYDIEVERAMKAEGELVKVTKDRDSLATVIQMMASDRVLARLRLVRDDQAPKNWDKWNHNRPDDISRDEENEGWFARAGGKTGFGRTIPEALRNVNREDLAITVEQVLSR